MTLLILFFLYLKFNLNFNKGVLFIKSMNMLLKLTSIASVFVFSACFPFKIRILLCIF